MADKEIINIDHDSLKAADGLKVGESLKIERDDNGRIIKITKESGNDSPLFIGFFIVLIGLSLVGAVSMLRWLL